MDRAIHTLSTLLMQRPYRSTAEVDLQAELARRLTGMGVRVVREHPVGPGRIDLYLPARGVGIEVKVKGSTAAVIRQLARYIEAGTLEYVALVTTNRRLFLEVPDEILGTPVHRILLPIYR